MAAFFTLITTAAVIVVMYYFWSQIMAAIDNMTREVTEARTATESAIALIEGMKARLDEAINSGDMSKVQALADDLSANTDRLAAAVAANTPNETEPPAEPGEPGDTDPKPTEPGQPDEQNRPI